MNQKSDEICEDGEKTCKKYVKSVSITFHLSFDMIINKDSWEADQKRITKWNGEIEIFVIQTESNLSF